MERGDFVVVHSPYGAGFSHRNRHRREETIDPGREVDFDRVTEDLRRRARTERLFVKNPPLHFIERLDTSLLDMFEHTFLIRPPEPMIASFMAEWPDLRADEIGLVELGVMFDAVVAHTGEIPPIIDAEDLVDHPTGTVRAYCAAVGIPFIPEALEWESERKSDFVYLHDVDWHRNLNQSTGLQRPDNAPRPTVETDPRLRELVEEVAPIHRRLEQHKLVPLDRHG